MTKNTASQSIGAQMINATTGAAFTGSVTVAVTGDAGTQATGSVGSGACTHEGNGYHTYAPAQAETNYDLIAFTFTGTGAIPTTVQVFTTAQAKGTTTLATPTNITAGTITTVTNLTNAPTSGDLTATMKTSVTTAATAATPTAAAVTGAVGSVTGNVGGNVVGTVASVVGAVGSVTGNVGGNVTGSVGSVATGGIASTSFAAGAINAAAIAADAITDAKVAADVTIASVTGAVGSVTGAVGSVTGNVGGNVVGSVASVTAGVTLAANAVSASALATDAAAEIADAVWDEATSGHTTAGTFGQRDYVIRANTAQAGASTTITLDASASATDDIYNNQILVITAGTGAGQSRIISDYNGTTKVATVPTWQTNPSSDSVFVILPFGAIPGASAPTAAEVADAVWDEAQADHVAAGSFGVTASEIADILVDTAEIGAAGAGLTNINLPNQTMDIVGNITGNLSGSVGSVTGAVGSVTGAVGSVTGNVGGNVTGSVGSVATGGIAAASFAANAVNAAALAADAVTEIQSGLATAAALATVDGIVDDILVDTADMQPKLGTPAGASISADIAAIEAQTDDIGAAGAGLTALATAASIAALNNLSAAQVNAEVVDALATDVIADSIPADGSRPTIAQALYLLTQFMTERAVSGTTMTVKKPDGSTTLLTLTLNDGTSPTSITRAS